MILNPLRLKYPIVLIHGLAARDTYGPFDYFYGLPKLLRDAGNHVFIPRLTPWHTIEHRAQQLKVQIEKSLPEGKLNLIGHSMGGLDARYLAAQPDFSDRVASLTTIGTPHRGSALADITAGVVPEIVYKAADPIFRLLGSNSQAIYQVTRKFCMSSLAEKMKDARDIGYFSATSAISPKAWMTNSLPLFWVPYQFMKRHEGDNDGFVSVESATHGIHICTYVGDHYGQIGQLVGRSRGLDYLKFYTEIITKLKSEGF